MYTQYLPAPTTGIVAVTLIGHSQWWGGGWTAIGQPAGSKVVYGLVHFLQVSSDFHLLFCWPTYKEKKGAGWVQKDGRGSNQCHHNPPLPDPWGGGGQNEGRGQGGGESGPGWRRRPPLYLPHRAPWTCTKETTSLRPFRAAPALSRTGLCMSEP